MLEGELFGDATFTEGAPPRKGKVKRAGGGTLFLDGIGPLSPSMQVKLVRVLQARVAADQPVVRFVVATKGALRDEVAAGLRQGLFYGLSPVSIEIPPLRDRPGDLLPLAMHFLQHFAGRSGKHIVGFDEEAAALITSYRWPGNVHEFDNVIAHAVALCDGEYVTAKQLPVGGEGTPWGAIRVPGSSMPEIERHAILTTLEACGGCTTQTAKLLKISVRKIQYRLREYGVARSVGTRGHFASPRASARCAARTT